MSSSSGGGSRTGQNSSTNKMKSTTLTKNTGPSSEFTLVSYTRKSKAKINPTSPVSPGLQQIINNPPILNTSNTAFNYNISDNTHEPIIIDDAINGNNRPNELDTATMLSTDNTTPLTTQNPSTNTHSNNNNNTLLRSFSPEYNGPIIILAESTDLNKNLGNLHPFKTAKFFSTNFTGITNIKPVGPKKVKITFNSITNGNLCLSSKIPCDNGFQVSIPVSLIFSYGVIKLDNNVSETEFFEGLHSPVPIENFKRISITKDGNIIQTRTVELKFIASKIPSVISIYNMLFEVKPSIRSPVQCNRCLRFGHTQKYCRSEVRCSHCGEAKHTLDTCPSTQTTDPVCLFCKLPHLATDRSCREWSTQKNIKKIMATENISYKDALAFKKNNCYTSAFKYSEIVNNQPPTSEFIEINSPLHNDHFPSLNDNHHFFNSKKIKHKSSPSQSKGHFTLPVVQSYSPPNGSYLNNPTNQSHLQEGTQNDFSWVHTLSLKLSESLINSPSLLSPLSPSSLQNLIESSLSSLLAIPMSNSLV
jgi:hypothetical protein